MIDTSTNSFTTDTSTSNDAATPAENTATPLTTPPKRGRKASPMTAVNKTKREIATLTIKLQKAENKVSSINTSLEAARARLSAQHTAIYRGEDMPA